MQTNQDEIGPDLESESFAFEMTEEFEMETAAEDSMGEAEEMELAAELLGVSSEEELDQFLGKFFKGAWKGLKKITRPLGRVLKGIAKSALPFIGGALGSFIPIPGVGTALGTAIGGAASKLLEVDLEGIGPEDREFELARRFVRLASHAASHAARIPDDANLNTAALQAVRNAADQLSGRPGQLVRRGNCGRWLRRGNRIVLLGV